MNESSNSIGHEDYHLIRLEDGIFLCFIRHKNSHHKLHWRANHSQFSLVHERWRGYWLDERISITSIAQGEQVQGRVMESLRGRSFFLSYVFFWKMNVWDEFFYLVFLFGKGGKWMCERSFFYLVFVFGRRGEWMCERSFFIFCFSLEKEENECVRRVFLIFFFGRRRKWMWKEN
jgi:hypothetical protein